MKKNKIDLEQLEDVIIELYKSSHDNLDKFIDALIEYRDACIIEGIEEDRSRSLKIMNTFLRAFPVEVRWHETNNERL